jgi:hypothetical protein
VKVTCRYCGELTPKEQAIRMNLAEYKTWEMVMVGAEFTSFSTSAHQEYTQICEVCFRKSKEKK